MTGGKIRKVDWERHIGRRLQLRDLHIFLAVAQRGSFSGGAAKLGVSQPAVSEVVSRLERVFGVRLFDRSPHGVRLTKYGDALCTRGAVVFDELRQTIRDIELLADPASGEVRIGCPETMLPVLSPVIRQFCRKHPRVMIDVHLLVTPPLDLPELRSRKLDVAVTRIVQPFPNKDEELESETLFEDGMVIVAGMRSRWARRRKIDLAELADENWILPPPGSWVYESVAQGFAARGLDLPKLNVATYSVYLRMDFLDAGGYVTAFPGSILRLNAERFPFKVLPVDIGARPWPVAIITLKKRNLSPVVRLFIDHLRGFTREISAELEGWKSA